MAQITTYATLKTEVENWLARSDLTSQVPTFIQLAENELYNDPDIRNRGLEEDFLEAIDGDGKIDVPDDFKAWKIVAYQDGPPLRATDPLTLREQYFGNETSSSGRPILIAREGDSFIFGPTPDDNYILEGTYFKKLTAMSQDADTNFFIDNYPGLLLYGALIHAEPFLENDPRSAVWREMYEKLIGIVRADEKREKFSAGGLRIRAG